MEAASRICGINKEDELLEICDGYDIEYIKSLGGIHGEEKGLELDAFAPDEVRRIFIENIRNLIEVEQYESFVEESYIRRAAIKGVSKKFEEQLKKVVKEFKGRLVPKKDFDILEMVQEGESSVNIEDVYYSVLDEEISNKMLEAFV
jgi:hypothetical protein